MELVTYVGSYGAETDPGSFQIPLSKGSGHLSAFFKCPVSEYCHAFLL